jgi:PAS domain S-box-containing protein
MRGKDGKIKEILFSARIIRIDRSRYMISIPFDVTDLKKSEEKIRSLASFIELNPNPILEIDGDGTVTMNNEAALLEIRKRTGTDDLTLFLPDDVADILVLIREGTETSLNREIILGERVFGEHIYVTNQYRTARFYLMDITGLKQAESELILKNETLAAAFEELQSTEEEIRQNYGRLSEQEEKLKESEKRLRTIVEHIPGLVLITDTTMKITNIYGSGLEKIGLSQTEAVGLRIEELFHDADPAMVSAHQKALDGQEITVEGHFRESDILLYATPIHDSSDVIIGTMGVAIDVTLQKRLEQEQKRLLRQLENNLVELSLLNDKIRNPLTIISSLVAMHAPGIEDPVQHAIRDIDGIIDNLDLRWMESEKTLRFLRRHYGVGEPP